MKLENFFKWFGIVAILAVGVIHLVYAPGEYEETPYVGILFFVTFLLSLLAAIGIYMEALITTWVRGSFLNVRAAFFWGWTLGWVLCVGSILGYLVSRTVGLPVAGAEEWGPLPAFLSILVEIIFLVLFYRWQPVILTIRRAKSAQNDGRVA